MPKLSRLPFFNYRAHPNDVPYYQPKRGSKEFTRVNRVLFGLGDPDEKELRDLGEFLCFKLNLLIFGFRTCLVASIRTVLE